MFTGKRQSRLFRVRADDYSKNGSCYLRKEEAMQRKAGLEPETLD